ncbi:hypothetical protein PENTCL1PPCAC_13130, partial [Pristionchus entomophagus]
LRQLRDGSSTQGGDKSRPRRTDNHVVIVSLQFSVIYRSLVQSKPTPIMPGGIIAWGKNRFLKRKSPERAVHVVLPPEPNMKHVRFDGWRESQSPGRSNSAMAVPILPNGAGRGPEWRYTDDVRVQIAPMARAEDLDARERRAMSAPRNPPPSMTSSGHAEYAPIAKDAFLEEPLRNHLDDVNVVFLQRNDEVKRTMLPSEIRTMRQVQAAFCRTFNLSMGYMQQPYVRIYIQEPRGQLFYELDDPMDIRDKSVLRLKEAPPTCPSPASRLEYLSDAELGSSISSAIARPASAMAAFSPQNFGPPSKSSSSALYDPYDPYASDTASSHDSRSMPRSGSATPIIDREARVRMDTMERQLQGLSSIVHSALKGMDETSVRDMEILRRQVLNLRTDRLPSEEPPSLPDSSLSSREGGRNERERMSSTPCSRERDMERAQQAQHLSVLRERVAQTATEMRQLRRQAQVNAQTSREIIRSAGDQILKLIAERLGRRAESVIPSRASDARREEHSRQLSGLLEDLTSFERNVEEVRTSVLNSNRKLRMSEVERLTTSLTEIGKAAAGLKTAVPSVHGQSEKDLVADMDRLQGEKTETITAIDQSLRRCKALANIMVTMKKLAMVQDPAMQKIKQSHSNAPSPSSSSSSSNGTTNHHNNNTLPPPPPSHASSAPPAPPPSPSPAQQASSVPPPPPPPPTPNAASKQNGEATIPPVPPSPVHYTSPTSSMDGAALREITSTPPPHSGPPSGPTSAPGGPPSGQPPRPPSRFSVRDARARAPLPPQSPSSSLSLPPPSPVNGMAPHSSPILATNQVFDAEAETRRVRLEERQAALAEKQRLLHTQFAQLQQLAPN